MENYQIRAAAREQLKGNWGVSILTFFLFMLITSAVSPIPVIGSIIVLLIGGPLSVGTYMYALRLKRGDKPSVSYLFDGFQFYGSSFGLYLWVGLWTFLWSLLLVIPGIIKALSYSMAFFILSDDPNVGVRNALNISKKITYGYKGKLFLLLLSFIGWDLLACLTLGIGFLWLVPYIYVSMANFYDNLKSEAVENGILSSDVLLPSGEGSLTV